MDNIIIPEKFLQELFTGRCICSLSFSVNVSNFIRYLVLVSFIFLDSFMKVVIYLDEDCIKSIQSELADSQIDPKSMHNKF